MSFGGQVNGVIRQGVDQFQQRAQQAENSTRHAVQYMTYTTTGVGQFVTTQPILFDCAFITEPSFVSGVALVQAPDPAHWFYPNVTAGVYRWVTDPAVPLTVDGHPDVPLNPSALIDAQAIAQKTADRPLAPDWLKTAADLGKALNPLYVGAYLYFTVRVDPLKPVRSDGSNLAALQAQLASQPTVAPLVAEAQEALYLAAHPAMTTMNHHVQFAGDAMKDLTFTGVLASDSSIIPTVSYGA